MTPADILMAAHKAVKDAEIDDDLRAVAFSKAVDMLLLEGGLESRPTGTRLAAPPSAHAAQEDVGPLDRIAQRLKLDRESVASTFYIKDNDFQLIVGHNKLPRAAAAATKEIALLVAAGRQAAGIDDEWTPVSIIREWCEHYKRLDTNNFAAAIKGMQDLFSFRGSTREREVRMSRPAWERAGELVSRLSSNGQGE
jgi:hypothetical protein